MKGEQKKIPRWIPLVIMPTVASLINIWIVSLAALFGEGTMSANSIVICVLILFGLLLAAVSAIGSRYNDIKFAKQRMIPLSALGGILLIEFLFTVCFPSSFARMMNVPVEFYGLSISALRVSGLAFFIISICAVLLGNIVIHTQTNILSICVSGGLMALACIIAVLSVTVLMFGQMEIFVAEGILFAGGFVVPFCFYPASKSTDEQAEHNSISQQKESSFSYLAAYKAKRK